MILFYSGPGNTRYIARQVAQALDEHDLRFIPELAREGHTTLRVEGALGIFFPVYAWAAPRLVTDYIARLSFSRRPDYIYMVCTAGDEAGLTEQLFRQALARKGLKLDAAFSVIMPETYINLPGFRLDSDEAAREKLSRATATVGLIAEAVRQRRQISAVERGSMAWLKSRIINSLFYRLIITDLKFRSDERCTACGQCARVCPLLNITVATRPEWHGRCTNCMACYHACPVNAIRFGRQTDGKGQFDIRRYLG